MLLQINNLLLPWYQGAVLISVCCILDERQRRYRWKETDSRAWRFGTKRFTLSIHDGREKPIDKSCGSGRAHEGAELSVQDEELLRDQMRH